MTSKRFLISYHHHLQIFPCPTQCKNSSRCRQRPLERARRGFSLRLQLVSHRPRPVTPHPPTQTCGPTLEPSRTPRSILAFPLPCPPTAPRLQPLEPLGLPLH